MTLRDRVSGGALLALSLIYFVAARGLPEGQDEPGPAFFPSLLAVALGIVSLFILLRPEKADPEVPPLKNSFLVLFATLAYVVAFAALGYWVSTLLYTFVMVIVSSPRRDWRWLAIPVLTTVALYGLFERGLGLSLSLP